MPASQRQFKDAIHEQIARISKAASVPKRLAPLGTLEAVEGDELVRRVRSGEATLLDVRPVEEYAAGHIPSARSIPGGLRAHHREQGVADWSACGWRVAAPGGRSRASRRTGARA